MAKTKQDIVKEIIDETTRSVPQITNYRTGGIFRLFIEVVASFIEKFYQELEQMLPNRFLQTATGKYLDLKAGELSLKRLPPTKTRGYVIFKKERDENIVVDKGKILATKPDIKGKVYRYKVLNKTNLEENKSEQLVAVEAEDVGSQYNVVGGQITELITPISGVSGIINDSSWIIKAGKNEESDESLRTRCMALWRGLSGVNKNAYINLVKSLSFVEDVRVLSTARGAGTVDILFTMTNNTIPDINNEEDAKRIAEVQNLIEEYKPIATDIRVKVPIKILIPVAVTVVTLPKVEIFVGDIEKRIEDYFAKLRIGDDFEPSALSSFLFGLTGIKSINVKADKVIISDLQVAQLGEFDVTLSKAEFS